MQDVRDINEAQLRELAADRDRNRSVQAKRRDLSQQLDDARQACHAQAEELEVIPSSTCPSKLMKNGSDM